MINKAIPYYLAPNEKEQKEMIEIYEKFSQDYEIKLKNEIIVVKKNYTSLNYDKSIEIYPEEGKLEKIFKKNRKDKSKTQVQIITFEKRYYIFETEDGEGIIIREKDPALSKKNKNKKKKKD